MPGPERVPGFGCGRSRLAWGIVLAVVAAVALLHTHAWRFTADDAFISFRYAEHWVRYGLPTYNPPGVDPKPVEGYTNFGWVALLAAASALGAPTPLAAEVLGRLSELAALAGVAALALRLSSGPWAAAIAAAICAATPEFVVWGSGGLEGPLAAASALGCVLAFETGRWRAAALAGAVAVLVRPDAGLLPAAYVVVAALDRGHLRHRDRLRALLRAVPWAVVPVALHGAFRLAVYGDPLPQTFHIKAGGTALASTFGTAYLEAWAAGLGAWTLAPALAAASRRTLPLLAAACVHLAYVVAVGGDFMAYGRLALPATCAAAVLAGVGAERVGRWLVHRWRRVGRIAAAAIFLLAAGLALRATFVRHRIDMARTRGWIDGRFEGVHTMDRFARVRVAAGRRLRRIVPPDTRLVVGAAGALPWASDLPAWDAFGLVVPDAPALARALPPERSRPGHQRVVPEAVLSRFDPDLLCHVGYHGPRRPPPSRIPRALRRTHVFACVDLGPLDDPHAEDGTFDGGTYCCLRPRDRLRDAFAPSP